MSNSRTTTIATDGDTDETTYPSFVAAVWTRSVKPGTVYSVPVSYIKPSPENDKLYRPVDPDDPAIIDLANSIFDHGIREPLVLTRDKYILSGHRRFAAAKLSGLDEVPARFEAIDYAADPDRFVVLLREYNRQREKTLAERAREEVVAVDAEDAYAALIRDRREKSDVSDFRGSAVKMGAKKTRRKISKAKRPMLDAIKAIIEKFADYLPISERKIHYELLSDPPLIHASKPNSTYKNDKLSSGKLSELLTRARLAGEIPMDAIADDTRPVVVANNQKTAGEFISNELHWFMRGHKRDLLQSQSVHVELLVEKLALQPIIKPVAEEYGIPYTIGRGYASLPPRAMMRDRFEQSGHDRLVLLVVSDCDPDGVVIAESFARSMRDDFDISSITAIRVALTPEQARERKLPTTLKAKESSSNYTAFVEEHGDDVWELDALDPADLQQMIREGIESVLDMDLFNAEVEQYKSDAALLMAKRARALFAIREADAGGEA